MEIQVQYIDGNISCFTMTDESRCLAIIQSIKPSEFFNQPMLRVQSGNQTTILSMSAVESVYFATSLKAELREQPPATTFRTITEAEYIETLETLRGRYEHQEKLFETGQCIDSLLALDCVSGKKHFMQIQVIAGHRLEQMRDLNIRLGQLTSVIPCSTEGYMAINPHNIIRIEMYPAPPESTHTAWMVD